MVYKVIRRRTWQQTGILVLVLVAAAALLRWPQAAATGVSRGLAVCGEVIIPSLFPLMVVSGVFIRSGVAGRVGQRMDRLTRRLFGLPGCCGTAWLVGAVGGYPAGAVATRELLERGEITRYEAKRLLLFCVNGGPAFIIGTVGARLLGNTYKGILLYIAHLLASLIIGVCSRQQPKEDCKNIPLDNSLSLAKSVSGAVENACASVVSLCGFVVLFSALLTLSSVSGVTKLLSSVLLFPFTGTPLPEALYTVFWEVSCGSMELVYSGLTGVALAFLLGAALGFGGMSVSFQVGGILSEHAVIGRSYWVARVWHALLGGGFAALLFGVLPMPASAAVSASVSFGTATVIQPVSVSAAASLAMLLLCGGFLWCVARE